MKSGLQNATCGVTQVSIVGYKLLLLYINVICNVSGILILYYLVMTQISLQAWKYWYDVYNWQRWIGYIRNMACLIQIIIKYLYIKLIFPNSQLIENNISINGLNWQKIIA